MKSLTGVKPPWPSVAKAAMQRKTPSCRQDQGSESMGPPNFPLDHQKVPSAGKTAPPSAIPPKATGGTHIKADRKKKPKGGTKLSAQLQDRQRNFQAMIRSSASGAVPLPLKEPFRNKRKI